MDDFISEILGIGLFAGRVIVGSTLVLTALAKLRAGRARFLGAVLGYGLLRPRAASIMASVIPPLELVVGLALITGVFSRPATVAAWSLLALFSLALVAALVRGRTNACGCTSGMTPVRWALVSRNAILALALVPTYVFEATLG